MQKNQIDSAVKYLNVFARWAKPKNQPAGQVGHFDNGVILSRYVTCSSRDLKNILFFLKKKGQLIILIIYIFSRDICGLKDCSLGGNGWPTV